MANQTPILGISPPKELSFTGTEFDTQQTQKLRLENISRTNLAFKVKTTALKAYLVRPSSSVLKPGEVQEVAIMLQKLQEVPTNHQHRFLVQAVPTQESEIASRESWQQMAAESTVQEFRLSVVFPDVNGGEGTESSQYTGANRDLQSKYAELADYTKALQERREELKKEVKQLEAESGTKKGGYQLFHIIVAIMMALFAVKVFEKMNAMK